MSRPPEPRRRSALWAAIGIGVVMVALVAVLATRDASSLRLAESPLLGGPAPELAGPSLLDQGLYDLEDDLGRFVLVNIFATWCQPCRAEHPDLLRFATAHAASGDASVVSVVFDDRPSDVEAFFAERGGAWPVLDDGEGRVIVDWGVTGVPESFLVGPDGTVRAKIVGGVDFDRLENLLADLGLTA